MKENEDQEVRDEPRVEPMPPDWIAKLRPRDQAKARSLIELLNAAGIDDAEDWVRFEMTENLPQAASAMFLRSLWPDCIDPDVKDLNWIDREIAESERHPRGAFADAGAALGRHLAAGADREDIGRVARMVAYETSYGVGAGLCGGLGEPPPAQASAQMIGGADQDEGHRAWNRAGTPVWPRS